MMLRRSHAGYTLIQIAIAVTVIGLLLASAGEAFTFYQKDKKATMTINNAKTVMAALSVYLAQHGHYPCPAPLSVPREDPLYGMEDAANCTAAIPANGLVRQDSPTPPGAGRFVKRGAVPFRILNLPEFASEDGYKNRLEYAVTEALTSTSTYGNTLGGIGVTDGGGVSQVTPPGTAHFLVLSHGEDKRGAYTHEAGAAPPVACGAVGVDGYDAENCANGPTAVYRSMNMAKNDGTKHFDDYVAFYPAVDLPFWLADATGNHIHDTQIAGTLGIGRTPPESSPLAGIVLHVKDNIRVATNFLLSQVCDPSGYKAGTGSCFDTWKILGPDPGAGGGDMKCPAGQYVTKLDGYGTKGARVVCATAGVGCPPGKVMVGVDAAKKIICNDPIVQAPAASANASCPALTINLCAKDDGTGSYTAALAAKAYGVSSTVGPVAPAANTYNETYLCQKGVWTKTASAGVCGTCDPAPVTKTYACNAWYLGPGSGWTGTTLDVTTTKDCTAAGVGVTEVAVDPNGADGTPPPVAGTNHCSCVTGATETVYDACPVGYTTGNIKRVKTWTCDPPDTTNHPGHWVEVTTNTCGGWGPPAAIVETLACPEGMTGSITKTTTAAAAAGTWNAPTYGGAGCVCSAGATKVKTRPCSAGSVGLNVDTYTMACPSGTWTGPVTTSSCTVTAKKWTAPDVTTLYTATSTTDVTIALGSTGAIDIVSTTKGFYPGQRVAITRSAMASQGVSGTVISYSKNILIVSADTILGGAGVTDNSWNIKGDGGVLSSDKGPLQVVTETSVTNITIAAALLNTTQTITVVPATAANLSGRATLACIAGAGSGGTISGAITSYAAPTLKVLVDAYTGAGLCTSWVIRNEHEPFAVGEACVTPSAVANALHRSCYSPAGKDLYYQYKDCICK